MKRTGRREWPADDRTFWGRCSSCGRMAPVRVVARDAPDASPGPAAVPPALCRPCHRAVDRGAPDRR